MMEVARPCSIIIQQPSCVVSVTDDDFADENVLETFSLSRSHALQRSQDSGAVTDWSRGSPTRHSCKSQDSFLSEGSREDPTKFVTVLPVNGGLGDRRSPPLPEEKLGPINPDFVTVLSIGQTAEESLIYPTSTGSISLKIESPPVAESRRNGVETTDHIVEAVTLIRRPGEKLGFGLKFDGGSEKNQWVRRLFIQCCAPGSAASSARCSWGKLGEADEILDICGEPVARLTRTQVVHQLTEGSSVLLLTIRHVWNAELRADIVAKYLRSTGTKEKSRQPKKNSAPQERAVDVPVEFLFSQVPISARDSWKLHRQLLACEELAPPVPPRRKRRSKKMTEVTTSQASLSPGKSTDDTLFFRSLPGTGKIASNGIRVNSAPNKPPRLRLQQSRSLGDERAAVNDPRPTPASAEVAFLNCLLPPADFIGDDQQTQHEIAEDDDDGQQVEEEPCTILSRSSVSIAEPPEAEIYINLIAEEDRRLSSLLDLESESDTNSSVSTIIDCWSIAPSSPSYMSLNRNKTFSDASAESLETLNSLRIQLEGSELKRGIVRETTPAVFMNECFSQTPDSDAEHDSGVGTTDETEPSSLGDDVIDPPEIFLDGPLPTEDSGDVTEIVGAVVGLQVGQIPAPDSSTLSSLAEEPECNDVADDSAAERSPVEADERRSDAETPSRDEEKEDMEDQTTDGDTNPTRREGPAVECRVEPSSTAVAVAEGLSAQSAAESSPPARKLPTAVQSESTATGTCRALDNKISINNNINSSNSNGDSKLTPSAIDESAWPNKNKIRRSRIPQAAVTPVRATAASRTASAVVDRKTPVRAASTSRVPCMVTGVSKAAPNVGRSSSSVAVNKIGTSPPTRTVNGTRTTSAAAASRSAYSDDNKAKEKEKPKRNVKSGLTTPATPSAPVHVASKIPRPCPPKKASSPSVNKIHWPAAANGKAALVKTVKKKPIGPSQLSQQASHHQGASMERMSLSSSPPSSRLPPDGHEFPANYDENAVDLSSSKCRPQRSSGGNAAANWRSNRDERSERSVRDKIALFTHDDRGQIRSAAAAATATTPTVASTTPLKSRRENASLGSSPTDTKYVAKTLSYSVDNLSSSINNNSNGTSNNNNNNNNGSSATLKALQGSTKGPLSSGLPRSRDFAAATSESSTLSERSRSLLDVAQSSQKRHSVGNLAATLAQRKTSLMNLAESRRKSISKLRGLVIPDPVEMKSDARLRSPRGIIDLPEIISKDSVLAQGKAVNLPTLSRTDPLRGSQSSVTSSTSSDATDSALKKTSLTSLPWKSNSASNTLPKYSPAFKRKELTVPRSYVLDSGQVERPAPSTKTGTTGTVDIVKQTPPVPLLPLPPLPTSKPPAVAPAKDLIDVVDSRTPSTVTSSHSHEESSDTDGDSALSSSRSSFSQSESPIPSADNKDEAKIGHQESSTSAVTAAATAARVLKAHSVEALNRKNVLQSARYSSGGGLDSPTSPPTPTESRPLKLSSPNRSSDSLSSPKDPSPLLARSRKAPDFEQTLKMFASSEKEAKSERMSPKSLRSGDRLEIKTAFINDVYDDPSSIQTTNDRMDIKVSPVDVTVVPTPATRKISSGSESSRRNSNEMDSKFLASKPSGGNGNVQRDTPREVKSFRALAERWEAMVNDTPVSSGSSSPLSPPAKSFPPIQNIAAAASKKLEVKVNEDDDDYSIKRFSLMSKLSHEAMSYESSVDHADHESSFTVVTSSITNNSSRSSKSMAGVVEIRKAFERVRGELETESSSNMDLPMGLNAHDELSSETFNIFKPHGIFSMSSNSNFASNSSCSTSYHTRMSSLDSNTSGEDGSFPYGGFGHYGIGIGLRDHYGSITSLASSTSLISPQELQQLLDDANQSLEESGTPSHEIVVVVLHRGDASGPASLGLGITLAGGADYETKEITVHKVISGSVADRDGRVQRGDRVLSINGKSLKGVTHREALSILKAPRPEVVLVLSRKRSVSPQDSCPDDKDLPMMITASNTIINSRIGSSGHVISSRPPRILESPSDFGNYDSEDVGRGPPLTTTLIKDGAGLGFSLEGGKDSPLGDRPLTVKKIFTGGAASKNGVLRVGDQIITVNGCDVTVMSRIEAWNLMKKLPDGVVTLVIRQSLNPASS